MNKDNTIIQSIINDDTDTLKNNLKPENTDLPSPVLKRTLLMDAAYYASNKTASYLLENGADPNFRDIEKNTPLMILIKAAFEDEYASKSIIEEVAEDEFRVSTYKTIENSELAESFRLEREKYRFKPDYNFFSLTTIADILISYGADPDLPDIYGNTPLSIAVRYDDLQVADYLLSLGASIDLPYMPSGELISIAARNRNKFLIRELTKKNADINQHGHHKRTALLEAASMGDADLAAGLIVQGADVNLGGHKGFTPLIWAAINGYMELAEVLIASGADVNKKTDAGISPLYYAKYNGHRELAEYLIEKGAEE